MSNLVRVIYTTILFDIRDTLGISNSEYIFCDQVFKLSVKTGWCDKNQKFMSSNVGISDRGLRKMADRLIQIGLIEQGATGKYKTTDKWYKTAVLQEAEQSSTFLDRNKVPQKAEQSSTSKRNKVPQKAEQSSSTKEIKEIKEEIKEININENLINADSANPVTSHAYPVIEKKTEAAAAKSDPDGINDGSLNIDNEDKLREKVLGFFKDETFANYFIEHYAVKGFKIENVKSYAQSFAVQFFKEKNLHTGDAKSVKKQLAAWSFIFSKDNKEIEATKKLNQYATPTPAQPTSDTKEHQEYIKKIIRLSASDLTDEQIQILIKNKGNNVELVKREFRRREIRKNEMSNQTA